MKKNIVFVSISVILLILLGIGLSYSMWNMSTSQGTSNVIASSECFDISITSQENNINLQNAYPISNEKGKKLTPFTFTVTNICETASKYSINLENLKGSTLSSAFLDVMLNNGEIKRLNTYSSANKVNSSSIESRELETGILGNKESKDYSLRLWIDYNTTLEDLNNEIKSFKSKIVVVGKPINYTGDTVFNFDYTGTEQTFIAPVSGTYRLEIWGAQGGYDIKTVENVADGVGGYSNGEVKLNKNQMIYLNIGGQGNNYTDNSISYGGYNGGGNGGITSETIEQAQGGSGGGGATHIATVSGILKTLLNEKDKILIVSGGGGGTGANADSDKTQKLFNGAGGGYIGNNGLYNSSWTYLYGTGGSQNKGGYDNDTKSNYGDFATGSDLHETGYGGNGGGGGYYGGGGTNRSHSGGGGGSGYIGNPLLTNKVMYCYNCEESNEESTKTISTTCSEETPTSYCAKKGNGYARITLVSIEE